MYWSQVCIFSSIFAFIILNLFYSVHLWRILFHSWKNTFVDSFVITSLHTVSCAVRVVKYMCILWLLCLNNCTELPKTLFFFREVLSKFCNSPFVCWMTLQVETWAIMKWWCTGSHESLRGGVFVRPKRRPKGP